MKEREIKERISSVNDTVKITKAMEMISMSKLQKSQRMFAGASKYLKDVSAAVDMLMTERFSEHPYFDIKKRGNKAAYFVIADDKGFCADYNTLVLDAARRDMESKNVTGIFAVGHMAEEYFRKIGETVNTAYTHLIQSPMPEDARAVTDDLIERFLDDETDEIYLVYTEPLSLNKHEIVIKRILPVEFKARTEAYPVLAGDDAVAEMLHQYVFAEIYYAIAAASLAVNYKRMTAMQQSTANGEEIAEKLVLEYNHKRQERITTELADSSFILLQKL